MSGIFDQIINYSPPLIVSGTVNYKGTWNASTNNPTLNNPPAASTKGDYYVVSTAGTQFSITFGVGDWIISNGTAWEKVDLTDAVSSVFGRTGAVVGVSTDYSAVGLTNTAIGASNPSTGAFTTISATTPIAVASGGTGVSTSTGTTNVVLSNSPTLVTPILGTPQSGTLTSCTGLPISTGVSGLGTGVATALAANVGSAGAPVVNGGALGTPSSGTVTNLTGTASININGTVGATTPSTVAATTGTFSGKVSIDGAASTYQLNVRRAGGGGQLSINIDGTSTPVIDRAIPYYAIGDGTNVTSGHAFYARNNNATDIQAATISSTGLNSTAIGASNPSTGAFTTLSATGTVTALGASFGGATGTGATGQTLNSQSANGNYVARFLNAAGTTQAGFAFENSGADFATYIASVERSRLSSTGLAVTGALSATGALAIGNTVAAAVAVASTHKVTIVIGGVTYYLLASNV